MINEQELINHQQRSDFDGAWKEALNHDFEDFMKLCWPEYYPQVDWQQGYEVMDTELKKISISANTQDRDADKLIKVKLLTGETPIIMVHLEIQSGYEKEFAERMLIYRYRIRDRYNVPIASIGVLIDNKPNWQPNSYKEEFWGSSLEIKFPIIKLLTYKNRMDELRESNNPFAEVILAQLAVLDRDPDRLLISKRELARHLLSKNFTKEQIARLFLIIDRIIRLPAKLEIVYNEEVLKMEKELNVNYISSMERMGHQRGLQQGIEQGREQGLQEGQKELLLRLLAKRYGVLPAEYVLRIEQADMSSILKWSERVLDGLSLEAIFQD